MPPDLSAANALKARPSSGSFFRSCVSNLVDDHAGVVLLHLYRPLLPESRLRQGPRFPVCSVRLVVGCRFRLEMHLKCTLELIQVNRPVVVFVNSTYGQLLSLVESKGVPADLAQQGGELCVAQRTRVVCVKHLKELTNGCAAL